MDKIFCIFIGGGIGSVLRYLITQIGYKYFKYYFVGTFIVNIVGCFLMGVIMGIALNKPNIISNNLKSLLTVGFLGGLTTFSTFSFEAFSFIREGKQLQGLIYIILSCLFCLGSAALGYYLSSKTLN